MISPPAAASAADRAAAANCWSSTADTPPRPTAASRRAVRASPVTPALAMPAWTATAASHWAARSQAARRALNTWTVGRAPAAAMRSRTPSAARQSPETECAAMRPTQA